jgi:hypothetical protein
MAGGVELEEGDACHLDGDAVAKARVALLASGLRTEGRVVWKRQG